MASTTRRWDRNHARSTSAVWRLGFGSTLFAALCERLRQGAFAGLFGALSPGWVLAGCTLLAATLAPVVSPRQSAPAWKSIFVWTPVFAGFVTLLDLIAPFSATINMAWPLSWLFYPSVAFAAETIFHVLPLSALLPLTHLVPEGRTRSSLRRAGLVAVMLIEPVFQAVYAEPGRAVWAQALTFVHIFAINVLLVSLQLRWGFAAAYAQRVAYYVYWHILYGALRLLWLP